MLQSSHSTRKFRVHKALLALKAKDLYVAFDRDFKEKKESRMSLQETTDDTVARFLEWAYTGDYSTDMYLPDPNESSGQAKTSELAEQEEPAPEDSPLADTSPVADEALVADEPVERLADEPAEELVDQEVAAEDAPPEEAPPKEPEGLDEPRLAEDSDANPTECIAENEYSVMDHHPLGCHARVYIFAEQWGIWPLKSLACSKLKVSIGLIGRPEGLIAQTAVVGLLQMAFNDLPSSDDLLLWLGQYCAWCVGQLRQLKSFENLMYLVGPAMLPYLNAASSAPWEPDPSSWEPDPEADPSLCKRRDKKKKYSRSSWDEYLRRQE